MTSKEAIKIIKKEAIESEYPEGWFIEELKIIEKDLEVLEILRRNVFKSDSSISIILDDLRNFEDFIKVKEWIENDK